MTTLGNAARAMKAVRAALKGEFALYIDLAREALKHAVRQKWIEFEDTMSFNHPEVSAKVRKIFLEHGFFRSDPDVMRLLMPGGWWLLTKRKAD